MAALFKLPVELMDPILNDISQRDLSSLARTSKPLRIALLPRLYTKIVLQWDNDHLPRVHLLLESILLHPERAKYIETLELRTDTVGCLIPRPGNWSLDRISPLLFINAAREAGIKVASYWTGLVDPEEAVKLMTAILIARCVDLKHLAIGTAFLFKNTWLASMLKHAALSSSTGRTHRFSKLVSVKLAPDSIIPYWSLYLHKISSNMILPFFYFRSVKSFDAPFYGLFHEQARLRWLNPDTLLANTLTTLRIRISIENPKSFHFFLRQTPSLTTLEYQYYFHRRDSYSPERTELFQALAEVSGTLQHLVMGFTVNYLDSVRLFDAGWSYHCDPLGSLKDWKMLQTLEMPPHVLFGWEAPTSPAFAEVLPANLKSLTLRHDLEHFDNFEPYDYAWKPDLSLEYMRRSLSVEHLEEKVPRLESINWVLSEKHFRDEEDANMYIWTEECRDQMRNICNLAGLECIVSRVENRPI